MLTRVFVFFVSIIIAEIWTNPLAEPTCQVKTDEIIDTCKVIVLDSLCPKDQVSNYLRRLARMPKMIFAPEVTNTKIENREIINGNLLLNISWHYSSQGYTINGFLIKANVYNDTLNKTEHYFIAEYNKRGTHNSSFQISNIALPEASEQSSVSISIWSLKHVKSHQKNTKNININICRRFTEIYENLRVSADTRKSRERRDQNYDEIESGPCSCWKDEMNVTTDLSNVYVTSINLCKRYPDILLTDKYLSMENFPRIQGKECDSSAECCVQFTNITEGLHKIRILFKCYVRNSDQPTCSVTTNINITAPPRYLDVYDDSSDDGIFVVTFIVIAVPLACAGLGLLMFLILRKRWRKTLPGDTESFSLLPNRVLFVSLIKDSSIKDMELTKYFDQMLRDFKVRTYTSDYIFRKIFDSNASISIKVAKCRLKEELVGFNHFIIITTKDLYESFERVGRTKIQVDSISVKDYALMHYLLAEAIIKLLHANIENQELTCNFIAPDERSVSYGRKIYSFMKPPKAVGRTYCLSKKLKFDKTKFSTLVQSLPKTIRNNEFLLMLDKLNPMRYLQILEQTNNQNRFISQPPNDSSAEESQTCVKRSDTSATMVKCAGGSGKESQQTFQKVGTTDCNDTIPKDIGQKIACSNPGHTKVKTLMSNDNKKDDLNDRQQDASTAKNCSQKCHEAPLVCNTSHDTQVKDVCDPEWTKPKILKDEMPCLKNMIQGALKERSVKFCLEDTKITISVDQDNTCNEEVCLENDREVPPNMEDNKEAVVTKITETVKKTDLSVWKIRKTEICVQEGGIRKTMTETRL